MEKNRGDNLLFLFGMEQNPSSLVARALHGLTLVDTDWATKERDRLVSLYGDPALGEVLTVSAETTFDVICDDLVAHGWHLTDSIRVKDPIVYTEADLPYGDMIRVRMLSTASLSGSHTVVLPRERVIPWIKDQEQSGNWELWQWAVAS